MSKSRRAKEPTTVDSALVAPVTSIMTRDVITVHQDDDLEVVRAQLLHHGIGCVPVVDALRCPVGIVSKTDVLRDGQDRPLTRTVVSVSDHDEDDGGMRVEQDVPVRVREVMTPVTVTLPASGTVGEAAALMSAESIHHLPIVLTDGAVVGLVSTMDVVRWLGRACGAAPAKSIRRPKSSASDAD